MQAINQWCRHDLDNCGMVRTRYDNCLCRQQARSVIDALAGTPHHDPFNSPRIIEDESLDAIRQAAADAEARQELLVLLAQIVAGTMLRPDAGMLIYLDDGQSTVRHIPLNVRERLLGLMTAVRPSG